MISMAGTLTALNHYFANTIGIFQAEHHDTLNAQGLNSFDAFLGIEDKDIKLLD